MFEETKECLSRAEGVVLVSQQGDRFFLEFNENRETFAFPSTKRREFIFEGVFPKPLTEEESIAAARSAFEILCRTSDRDYFPASSREDIANTIRAPRIKVDALGEELLQVDEKVERHAGSFKTRTAWITALLLADLIMTGVGIWSVWNAPFAAPVTPESIRVRLLAALHDTRTQKLAEADSAEGGWEVRERFRKSAE